MTIDHAVHLQVTLRITDPAHPETQAMPKGQHVHLNVGFRLTPDGPVVWDIERLYEVHRFLTDIHFTEADKGKEAFFRVRYVNTKGEAAMWSSPISTVIA